ncbi:cation-dependent mannose-6-phosphate receptor-like [Zootermopsis nevadensis]|uniref:Cation-dependent mannose-6-phosphate receptor n=1 Tax=Zootermopsis nevadensis TaxID=136037 RepID=A0A067RL50_ZOONE|nr:cation-dependent mannose-6-phosphate receptor-like [Zootermopsis nevadensis]KDR24547.1 Cation-dependent mannose-6-phosphate receptor [Zootermopsis nevadensis]
MIYSYGIGFMLLIFKFSFITCDYTQNCKLRSESSDIKRQLIQRLSPIQGQKFHVDSGGISYVITICSDASEKYPNSSVLEKQGTASTVLGRYNDTDIVGGESWLILIYGDGDGDQKNEFCKLARRVQILITCKEENEDPSLYFLEYNRNWNNTGCFFSFELQTSALCVKTGLSGGSVFCIIILTCFAVYFIVGVAHRRFIGGAKGFEQIPHRGFWKELGNLQADGCNLVCRRDIHREESWHRLTNNFNDPHDDRDEALLKP